MTTIKFQCTGKNEYLNGTQKTCQLSFSPFVEEGSAPAVVASGFSVTFTDSPEDAAAYSLGQVYEISLGASAKPVAANNTPSTVK